jgi:hypothetical protein
MHPAHSDLECRNSRKLSDSAFFPNTSRISAPSCLCAGSSSCSWASSFSFKAWRCPKTGASYAHRGEPKHFLPCHFNSADSPIHILVSLLLQLVNSRINDVENPRPS